MKKRRLLITTAIDNCRLPDSPVLFAGEWCLPALGDKSLSSLDYDVLPYRWDSHDKLHIDLHQLDIIYEKILQELSILLNEIHETTHGKRYWRIILGPWLYTFIHTLFFKWKVAEAAASYGGLTTVFLDIKAANYIPNEFSDIDPDDSNWQHLLFSEAIKSQDKIPWIVDGVSYTKSKVKTPTSAIGNSPLYKFSQYLSGLLVRQREIFLTDTRLGLIADMLVQIRFGQLPRFWKPPPTIPCEADLTKRQQLARNFSKKCSLRDPFISFVKEMSLRYIPSAYLEGYPDNLALIKNLNWPTRPLLIFTSNAFQFSEVFKIWAALRVEEGSHFVIGQHGGFYGTGRFVAGEKHQKEVSDAFLSWGWKSADDKVIPAYNFINPSHKPLKWAPNGNLLLVTVPIRRTVYKLSSWPTGARQSSEMIEDQIRFAKCLEKNIQKHLVCRLFAQHDNRMATGYQLNWKKQFPDVKIDSSDEPISKAISKCRLFIYTYNSTGWIEGLMGNVPTILFWRPDRWYLRNEAEFSFDEMKRVGIFHESAESAADHVLRVWDDVTGWWESEEVQSVRVSTCETFGRKSTKPIQRICDLLRSVCEKH